MADESPAANDSDVRSAFSDSIATSDATSLTGPSVLNPTVVKMAHQTERSEAAEELLLRIKKQRNTAKHVYKVSFQFSKAKNADHHVVYFTHDDRLSSSHQIVSAWTERVLYKRDQGGPAHPGITIATPHGMVGEYVKENPHYVPKDGRISNHRNSRAQVEKFYSKDVEPETREFNNIFE